MKVYQIEVSNLCNLQCSYCPHPGQQRPKGLMSWSTFERAIELLRRCGQTRTYLHNFGEPLLHPHLPEFVSYATTRGVACSFFTNGELLDRRLAMRLADAGLREICVSGHIAGEVERVQQLLAECGSRIAIADTFRPSRSTNHAWAGQVRAAPSGSNQLPALDVTTRGEPCVFEREQAFVVHWDGRIGTCCITSEVDSDAPTVGELLAGRPYAFRPVSLCASCTLMRGHEEL